MAALSFKKHFILIILAVVCVWSYGQESVPLGIHYQAVARDVSGKEMASKDIDVRFSIISDNPLGTTVYQELHSDVITSKYGVFSLIIGEGEVTGGIYTKLSQIKWSEALHYLKIEVKFDNTFIEMGTMKFLAVPYALYAQKSLEPGPQGPKGDSGPQGIQGVEGVQGLKGDTGPQGVKGDTGPQGQQGVQGLKGDTGPQGVKGDTGPQGQQGVQGLKGDAGIQGPKGDAGVQGQQGVQGQKGDLGLQGLKGDTGPQGQQGVQGLKGDAGIQGPKGDAGVQGPQGVQGLKGDQGDPASDNQTLSFDGSNLSISMGSGGTPSTVNLSTLNVPHSLTVTGNILSIMGGNEVVLPDQIQDLSLDANNILKINKNTTATLIDLTPYKQSLTFNSLTGSLGISNGTGVDLSALRNDAIQDLSLDLNNKLTITKNTTPTVIDLAVFKQNLGYNPATGFLSISDGTGVDLSALKTDEIQDISLSGNHLAIDKNSSSVGVELDKYDNSILTYTPENYQLSISNGNSVPIGSIIAFRAKKTISVAASSLSDVTFIPSSVDYNDGNAFTSSTGEFVAPVSGIYTFNVTYFADGTGGSRKLSIYYNSDPDPYEDMAVEIAAGTQITVKSLTMKLVADDIVKLVINTGTSTQTGTGTFSGFRVY